MANNAPIEGGEAKAVLNNDENEEEKARNILQYLSKCVKHQRPIPGMVCDNKTFRKKSQGNITPKAVFDRELIHQITKFFSKIWKKKENKRSRLREGEKGVMCERVCVMRDRNKRTGSPDRATRRSQVREWEYFKPHLTTM